MRKIELAGCGAFSPAPYPQHFKLLQLVESGRAPLSDVNCKG